MRLVNNPWLIPNPRFYKIGAHDRAWDVGGYHGGWTRDFRDVSDGQVDAFEPHPGHYKIMEARLNGVQGVRMHEYALGGSTRPGLLSDAGDGSSIIGDDAKIAAWIVDVATAAKDHGIPDVMKLNVEGAEYEILETMLDAGLVAPVRLFLIQFHKVVPEYERRYEQIAARLRETHDCLVSRPFVWDAWERRA